MSSFLSLFPTLVLGSLMPEEVPPFKLFSLWHLAAVLGFGILGVWILKEARSAQKQGLFSEEKELRTLLLWLLAFSAPWSFLDKFFLTSLPFNHILPLHLCSLLSYVALYALWKEKNWAICATYSLGLLACAQGLITPALEFNPPHPLFFEFFATHTLLVVVALYFPLVLGWRAQVKNIYSTWLLSMGYLLALLLLNPLLGTNYAFVLSPPSGGSILDLFGPWPWYVLGMMILGYPCLWLITWPVLEKSEKQRLKARFTHLLKVSRKKP